MEIYKAPLFSELPILNTINGQQWQDNSSMLEEYYSSTVGDECHWSAFGGSETNFD